MSMEKGMIAGLMSLLLLSGSAQAQAGKNAPAYDPSVPKPTLEEVRYGEHERHVLDFWKAPSDTPTPLVVCIHSGRCNWYHAGETRRAWRLLWRKWEINPDLSEMTTALDMVKGIVVEY